MSLVARTLNRYDNRYLTEAAPPSQTLESSEEWGERRWELTYIETAVVPQRLMLQNWYTIVWRM